MDSIIPTKLYMAVLAHGDDDWNIMLLADSLDELKHMIARSIVNYRISYVANVDIYIIDGGLPYPTDRDILHIFYVPFTQSVHSSDIRDAMITTPFNVQEVRDFMKAVWESEYYKALVAKQNEKDMAEKKAKREQREVESKELRRLQYEELKKEFENSQP